MYLMQRWRHYRATICFQSGQKQLTMDTNAQDAQKVLVWHCKHSSTILNVVIYTSTDLKTSCITSMTISASRAARSRSVVNVRQLKTRDLRAENFFKMIKYNKHIGRDSLLHLVCLVPAPNFARSTCDCFGAPRRSHRRLWCGSRSVR